MTLQCIFNCRRRSAGASSAGKKNVASTSSSTTAAKPVGKSSDKAPLLEQKADTSKPGAKPKLVPERTVQIGEANTTRFKSNAATDSKPGPAKPDAGPAKPALTAADSGIYGADLSEDSKTPLKPAVPPPTPIPDPPELASSSTPAALVEIPPVTESVAPATATTTASETEPTASIVAKTEPEAEPSTTLPAESVPEPVTTVVVNPLSENTTLSAIVVPNHVELNPLSTHEKEYTLDNTIHSAYPNLIDATTSENEGTSCGSALQSRRTSHLKQPVPIPESNNLETVVISECAETSSHNTIPFNPLHVILKKDANKYYTTEYI